MVAPRPASISSFCSPASTSIAGPNRSGRGIGVPVPRRVMRKSVLEVMSVGLDTRGLDGRGPFGDFAFHKRLQVLRRPAGRWKEMGAEILHAFLDVWRVH